MRKGINGIRMVKLFEQNIRTNERQSSNALLSNEIYYPDDIKQRVRDLIIMQRRKYHYLF